MSLCSRAGASFTSSGVALPTKMDSSDTLSYLALFTHLYTAQSFLIPSLLSDEDSGCYIDDLLDHLPDAKMEITVDLSSTSRRSRRTTVVLQSGYTRQLIGDNYINTMKALLFDETCIPPTFNSLVWPMFNCPTEISHITVPAIVQFLKYTTPIDVQYRYELIYPYGDAFMQQICVRVVRERYNWSVAVYTEKVIKRIENPYERRRAMEWRERVEMCFTSIVNDLMEDVDDGFPRYSKDSNDSNNLNDLNEWNEKLFAAYYR